MDPSDEIHAVRISKAFADPVRFLIYKRICELDEMGCGDICLQSSVGASTVSHHLKILADSGLIEGRKEGSFVYYRPIPGVLRAYLMSLYSLELSTDSEIALEKKGANHKLK